MKTIIICADGTWNLRDQIDEDTGKRRPTNVTKLARAISARTKAGIDQVVFYQDGVGTSGGMDRLTGGAFGRGIEDNVRDIYRFLIYNYVSGDQIFLFGFSRGAFTVRTLAGFMNKVGLLQKDDDYYVPEVYECYERNFQPGSPEWIKAFHNVKDPLPPPEIRMIGVWDTVGALGAPGVLGQVVNGKKYQYHNVGLTPEIRNAFHAMAIDERRKPFEVNLWERTSGWNGVLEQVWFAGVHSNVGGSYKPDGLANEALHWLVEKAEGLGLEVDDSYLAHFRPCFNSTLNDSMTAKYRLLGTFVRPVGHALAHGEAIHRSALDRLAHKSSKYTPENALTAAPIQSSVTVVVNGKELPIADTRRIPRGVACPDEQVVRT
jgi:uncharacterized protein (DUF2235 family)